MKCIVFKKKEISRGADRVGRSIVNVTAENIPRSTFPPLANTLHLLGCHRFIISDKRILNKFLKFIKKIQKKGRIVEMTIMVDNLIIDVRYFKSSKDAANWEGQRKYKALFGNPQKILKDHGKLFKDGYLSERVIELKKKHLMIYKKLIGTVSLDSSPRGQPPQLPPPLEIRTNIVV